MGDGVVGDGFPNKSNSNLNQRGMTIVYHGLWRLRPLANSVTEAWWAVVTFRNCNAQDTGCILCLPPLKHEMWPQ